MDLAELISTGWRTHESDTEAVAAALEEHAALAADGAGAAQVAALASHAMGEHLRDWPRAVRLLERITGALPRDASLSPALGNLSVARFFAGDPAGAVAAETEAAALAGDRALAALVRVRMLLASGLLTAKGPAECGAVYRAALSLAALLPEGTPADRAVAVTSNNLASALLGRASRAEGEDALMLEAAAASRTFWLRAGTWENDERADYLLALVHNATGRYDEGLAFAVRGLATIARNGAEPVDEAFLRLAAAGARRGLGDAEGHARELAAAEALAAAFEDEGLTRWFEGEAGKVR